MVEEVERGGLFWERSHEKGHPYDKKIAWFKRDDFGRSGLRLKNASAKSCN